MQDAPFTGATNSIYQAVILSLFQLAPDFTYWQPVCDLHRYCITLCSLASKPRLQNGFDGSQCDHLRKACLVRTHLAHQGGVYLRSSWHDVTGTISIPPWMGCQSVASRKAPIPNQLQMGWSAGRFY